MSNKTSISLHIYETEFRSNSWPGSGGSHMVINVYNGTNRYIPTLPANLISLHVLIHVHFENARKGTRGIECRKFDTCYSEEYAAGHFGGMNFFLDALHLYCILWTGQSIPLAMLAVSTLRMKCFWSPYICTVYCAQGRVYRWLCWRCQL
jgi:hypothetical protein